MVSYAEYFLPVFAIGKRIFDIFLPLSSLKI